MTNQREDSTEAIKQAFVAGWKIGYYDGHEHDCRMFTPTAERAWDDYQRETLSQTGERWRAMLGIAELHVTSKDFCPACGRNYATEATS